MKLFKAKEEKALKQLLACAVDQDEVLSLESLHGFLFCLAIIPDVVHPSEWLPCVFGEEMIEVADEKEGSRLLAPLFLTYNRMVAGSNQGELVFPFDLGKLRAADLDRIRRWCYGFFLGTNLRPEVWDLPDEEDADVSDVEADANASEDEREMAACMGVVMGIAFPERANEIFVKEGGEPEGDPSELREQQAHLFMLLPRAIESFQEVARSYGEMKVQERKTAPVHHRGRRKAKVGRNDPCPCGSGKKYKKCCGVN